jgi:hypothetical protein
MVAMPTIPFFFLNVWSYKECRHVGILVPLLLLARANNLYYFILSSMIDKRDIFFLILLIFWKDRPLVFAQLCEVKLPIKVDLLIDESYQIDKTVGIHSWLSLAFSSCPFYPSLLMIHAFCHWEFVVLLHHREWRPWFWRGKDTRTNVLGNREDQCWARFREPSLIMDTFEASIWHRSNSESTW